MQKYLILNISVLCQNECLCDVSLLLQKWRGKIDSVNNKWRQSPLILEWQNRNFCIVFPYSHELHRHWANKCSLVYTFSSFGSGYKRPFPVSLLTSLTCNQNQSAPKIINPRNQHQRLHNRVCFRGFIFTVTRYFMYSWFGGGQPPVKSFRYHLLLWNSAPEWIFFTWHYNTFQNEDHKIWKRNRWPAWGISNRSSQTQAFLMIALL